MELIGLYIHKHNMLNRVLLNFSNKIKITDVDIKEIYEKDEEGDEEIEKIEESSTSEKPSKTARDYEEEDYIPDIDYLQNLDKTEEDSFGEISDSIEENPPEGFEELDFFDYESDKDAIISNKPIEKFKISNYLVVIEYAKIESKLPQGFFEKNIVNINAIIGENGSGKTSLIKFILGALKGDFDSDENLWLLIFLDKDSKLRILTSFEEERNDEFYDLIRQITTIYYTPLFTLRSPVQLADIDLSTDFLLYADSKQNSEIDGNDNPVKNQDQKEKEIIKSRIFQVAVHRFKNYQRQIDLVNSILYKYTLNHLKLENLSELNIKIDLSGLELDDNFASEIERDGIITYIKRKLQSFVNPRVIALLGFSIYLIIVSYLKNKENKESFSNIWDDYRKDIDDNNIVYATIELAKRVWKDENKVNFINAIYYLIENAVSAKVENFSRIPFRRRRFYLGEIILKVKIDNKTDRNENEGLFEKLKLDDYAAFVEATGQDILSFDWPLSSGQKSVLDLFSRLYYAKQRIESQNGRPKYIYLFLDEAETSFHPEWQRKFLKVLVEFVSELFEGYQVQIFLASHSPLLISDLPKSNIIFLKGRGNKDEKLLQIASDDETPETFAANLNNILANGFFVKDLVGEFAKEKLNGILKEMKAYKGVLDFIESYDEFREIYDILKNKVKKSQSFCKELSVLSKTKKNACLVKYVKEISKKYDVSAEKFLELCKNDEEGTKKLVSFCENISRLTYIKDLSKEKEYITDVISMIGDDLLRQLLFINYKQILGKKEAVAKIDLIQKLRNMDLSSEQIEQIKKILNQNDKA